MSCLVNSELWALISNFLNSSFATALLGSLAGAWAGARAAQTIAERAKERDELAEEIRTTNAATMLAFSACNAAIGIYSQHVLPLFKQFKEDKGRIESALQRSRAGQTLAQDESSFVADMRVFPPPIAPISSLKEIVYHRLSLSGRPLALLSFLEQSFIGIEETINKRDALVTRFASGDIPKPLYVNFYFGFPLPNGDTNQEYSGCVEALESYFRDVIFFAATLCGDLADHASEGRKKYISRFKVGAPPANRVDFTGPRSKRLIPPNEEYIDWINAFTGNASPNGQDK